MFFHGTDQSSARGLVSGQHLDRDIAAARKIDGEAGFYLASDEGDAEFFAARRGTGSVIVIEIEEEALQALEDAGSRRRPTQ